MEPDAHVQRIGRLDHVGQTQNVLICNFAVHGTLDERILYVLESRIRIFTESVGALDPILGLVEARIAEIMPADLVRGTHNYVGVTRAMEFRWDTAQASQATTPTSSS